MPVSNSGVAATSVRWRIVALLAGFSLVSYALRTNISIAAAIMRTELNLDQIQIGQVFSAFLVGYAIFQAPAGAIGDRLGPRRVLAGAATVWGLATLLTGALPGVVGGAAGVLAVLMIVRFVLGAAEAATYPVAAATIGAWMPPTERAFSNSLVIAGMALGSAFIPPLMAQLMVTSGWRMSFYATSILGFLIAALWWWYARDTPSQHSAANEEELRVISAGRVAYEDRAGADGRLIFHWPLLRSRNMLLISASYFLDSYVLAVFVYWFYLYLIDERGFSMLKGGIFSTLPWIAALVLVPAGGRWCDRLSASRGPRVGRRVVAMVALVTSSVLLILGARAADPLLAIGVLSLSVGFVMATEGPFWSSAIDVSGSHAGTAGGIMNTAGNLGGVAATSLVPILVKQFGWSTALAAGSVCGLASALLWMLIRVDQVEPEVSSS